MHDTLSEVINSPSGQLAVHDPLSEVINSLAGQLTRQDSLLEEISSPVAFLALLPEQPSFRVRGYANRPRRTQVCDGTMKVRK